MFPLSPTRIVNKSNLVSSAQIKAVLNKQIDINCLCIREISLKEFLSFQGWLPPNTPDFLSQQWLIGLKKQKQQRLRVEWSNSLAVARLKSIVKREQIKN